MKLKRFLSCALASTMMLSALASCSSGGGDTGTGSGTAGGGSTVSTAQSGSKDPTTLMVAQGADAKSLNPQASNDSVSSAVSKQIYNTLFSQDEDMNITPALAESYELLEDGKVLKLKLREGVLFHNGEEFKAVDVKYTLDNALVSPDVAHIVGPIESVVIDSDYEVTITLEYSFAPILAHLSHTAISILNEKAVTEAGDAYGLDVVVGTGPYQFVSWTVGDRIELTRFDDYWDGVGATENITFRSIPEDSSRFLELESGGIDIAYAIAPSDIERAESTEGIELVRSANFSNSYVGFNTQKEPFDNVKVRQAINLALDIETIVEVVYYGAGSVATGPIGQKVWGYNGDVDSYGYDVEAAKALLAEAGYPDGFSTTIWTNDNAQRIMIAEIVQNQLREIGIEVAVEKLEWATYLDGTSAGQHEMFILGWVAVTGDPDYAMYACFHSDTHGASGNRTFYANDKVDELLDLARSTADQDEREAAYKEVQEIVVEEAPWIFTWEGEELTAVASHVENFVNSPAGHHNLKDVAIS